MHDRPRHTSWAQPRSAQVAAALFALAAAAGLWSSATAAADPSGQAPMKPGASAQPEDNNTADGLDDDQSSDDPDRGRNPYVSGPLANVGGPNSGEGQQDIGQALDNVLGGDGQGDGIGQSIGDLLGTGAQGVGADGISQAVGGLLHGAQGGAGSDTIGQAIGGLLGSGSNNEGVMGSGLLGGSSASGGESDGQVPETVRKGVIRLNRALGDTGYNSGPDSRGAGTAANSDGNEPKTGDAENEDDET
jgi:hypothetical protein